jgi:hypothetical protein
MNIGDGGLEFSSESPVLESGTLYVVGYVTVFHHREYSISKFSYVEASFYCKRDKWSSYSTYNNKDRMCVLRIVAFALLRHI